MLIISHCISVSFNVGSETPTSSPLPVLTLKTDTWRDDVISQGYKAWKYLCSLLLYRNRVKIKEMYTRFAKLFRGLHRHGGIVINNIFCAVLVMMCGLRIHSSFKVMLWEVPNIFDLGVDRKITAYQDYFEKNFLRTQRVHCIPQHPLSCDRL